MNNTFNKLKMALECISSELPEDVQKTARLQFLAGHLDPVGMINIHDLRRKGIDITDEEFGKILLHRAARLGLRPEKDLIKPSAHPNL
jgi:hypothetical protein